MKRASANVAKVGLPEVGAKKRKLGHHWSQGLYHAMEDPELVVEKLEDVVVIKDKFPKAQYHYLALPKEVISNISKLTPEHLPLLRKMEKIGRDLAAKHPDAEFRFGYHGVPSMHQIHLHVISQDFVSDCLKTKKHFNSFTTDYFRESADVIEELEKTGKVKMLDAVVAKQHLDRPLKCNQCASFSCKTMPELKKHLSSHLAKRKK